MAVTLAIDIGGTKMACGLVDQEGQLGVSRTVPTGSGDPWPALATLVRSVLGDAPSAVSGPVSSDVLACGVGCSGPMTPGGESVSPLNIVGWRDFPLRARLVELTGLPVFIDNDAKALALAEGWRGGAMGQRDYLAMVVSTGVGGGIVLDGRLLHGAASNAGHIGHVRVIDGPQARACSCGGRGCLEAEVSGWAIEEMTGAPAMDAPAWLRARCGTLTGRAIANVAALLDVRLALVAGSVALGFGEPFFASARRACAEQARIGYLRDGVRIEPAGLGANGPLVGAAAVARSALASADLGLGGSRA